jgi:outer membrane protein OmpA-like peptidoglycan-associated protein
MGVIVGIFVQDLKRKETMDQIARGRRLPVVVFTGVLLVAVVVLPAYRAVAQSPSPQTQAFHENVKEVYFPFNIYNRIIDKATLDSNAQWLKQNPDAKMWIQGYADPRGDIVYNLVLSYRRAQWIKTQLVKRGVDESRIGYATGWGKLYQTCEAKDDKCFQQNRRVDTVPPEDLLFHLSGL